MKNTVLKLTSMLLSALMFTAWGSKKNDSNPDTTDEPALEQPFLELAAADFKEINVPVTIADGASPVEVQSLDISALDFGERIAPCKTPENFEQYNIFGNSEKWKEQTESFINAPVKGKAVNFFKDGDKIYMVVSYDEVCIGEHEWSLFEYDPSTAELREVYGYSGIEENRFSPLGVKDGKIYFSEGNRLYTVDVETAEESTLYEADNWFNCFMSGGDEFLIYESETKDEKVIKIVLSVFSPESGELREIYSGNADDLKSAQNSGIPSFLVKPEDSRRLDFVTDYYCIETSITNGSILYASENKAMVLAEDILHTYDLEKMEHYVTDISEIGDWFAVCGDYVLADGSNSSVDIPIYCFMPDTGLAFGITKAANYSSFFNRNGTVMFAERIVEPFVLESDGWSFTHDIVTFTKLYWCE